jgi:glycosyltransferase involved in cell wall biosynthesis
MRICYINRFLNVPWGCGIHGQSLVKGWLDGGHEVLSLPQPLRTEDTDPVPIVGRLAWLPPAIHGPVQDARARFVAARDASTVVARVEEFGADILIARRARYDRSLDAVLRRLGRPYIAEVNAVLADEAAELTRERLLPGERGRECHYLRTASGVVCVSDIVRDQVRALGVPAERLSVLPNGVDTDLFSPAAPPDAATAHWAGGFERVYGHAGTMGATHDTIGLVDAAAALAKQRPDAGFLFVGPKLTDLQRQPTWDPALEPRVRCTGRVPHRNVPGHLASAHILWASFRNDYGSPLKLYEYLALGKPVVLAGAGQAVNVVNESRCGTAIPRGDARQLAVAALALGALSPEELVGLGANGRGWVKGRHTWSAVAEDFLESASMFMIGCGSGASTE